MDNNRKFVPSLDQLKQDITSIYIDENMDYAHCHRRLGYHLDPNYPENVPDLTYEFILQRYRAHIELWFKRHGATEARGYLSKADASKRKNFIDFLEQRMYNIDWASQSGTPIRDLYLFGNIKQSKLTEQRKNFLENLSLKNR